MTFTIYINNNRGPSTPRHEWPSKHESGRLPVLDVEMWIDEASNVQFSFFKKPMSSPFVNLYRSALPTKTKRESLLQEGLRRLRRMSYAVTMREKNQIMSSFMNSLRISGYDETYRYNLLKGILKRHEEILDQVSKGERILYRNRLDIGAAKQGKIGTYTNTWFLRGTDTVTFKVQSTPGGQLASGVKKGLRNMKCPDGGTIKIVEMGGVPITRGLTKGDPFASKECPFPEKCDTKENVNCMTSRAVYLYNCITCKNDQKQTVYVGTTGRCLHSRSREHKVATEKGNQNNPISKHQILEHSGTPPCFEAEIIKGSIRFNTDRFVLESLKIEGLQSDPNVKILNNKSEWGHGSLKRTRIENT